MRVSIQVEGYSPPGVYTDIEVSADTREEHYMLSDVGKPNFLQGEMILLLGRSVTQLCQIYNIDPADLKIGRVVDEPVKAPPPPPPVRRECPACRGVGKFLWLRCNYCDAKGWVMV